MNITAIKHVENRSRSTVTLLEYKDGRVVSQSAPIAPAASLVVDHWIPWVSDAPAFSKNRLELRLNGHPRFAIWQAHRGDGDLVRFSTDGRWHDPGEQIFGVPEVSGDRTLRVMSRYCSLLPHALPLPLAHVTTISRVENRSRWTVTLFNAEHSAFPPAKIGPQQVVNLDPHSHRVPWASRAPDFPGHHLQIRFDDQPRYWLWQAAGTDGDLIRFSTDGRWHDQGEAVHGLSGVNGRRTLVINEDGCFQLMAQDVFGMSIPDLQGLLGMGDHRLCEEQPGNKRQAVASIPKRSAVAFSVAGIPSDAFDRKAPGARFLYRDSGKRYAFRIDDRGVVVATHPDGRTTALTRACSFTHKRTGEEADAPPFDLIAASGGRVFAKARGQDQFFFTTMDHLFIHAGDNGDEVAVPSTYFKLDPEFNQPDARDGDLTEHIRGCFGEHPAIERFPQLFWPILEQNVMDAMIVRVDRGKWHLIDARPPLSRLNLPLVVLELFRRALTLNPLNVSNPLAHVVPELVKALLARTGTQDDAKTPPGFVQTYEHVRYCRNDVLGAHTIPLRSINYHRVLDIGVGHVHWHEQYQRVTGGEFQPMRSGRLLNDKLPYLTWMDLYRLASGPIRDGDGFIDGTCNYYILVQLKPDDEIDPDHNGKVDRIRPDAFGILYADEQFYFTQRWRLVHPDDHQGLMTALVVGLKDDLEWDPVFQRPLYGWNPHTYWCPFRAGHIGLKSRMAVAAQVLLVTGGNPPDAQRDVIYSINFSYSTMDRTWRWRALPGEVRYFTTLAERWDETIQPHLGDSVYPETVRLREDMTIHLKGTKGGAAGRWHQRYLPAGNTLVPSASELLPGQRPRTGFSHPWKFLSEAVFTHADRFSHIGVYDTVDSRTQYYPVTPASDADARALAEGQMGAWVDEGGQLYVDAWRFPWHGGTPSWGAKRPPSLFEPVTRLRIVKRGSRWLAIHWDKRDDDLIPFAELPKTVMLTNGEASAKVTLDPNVWLEEAPGVRRVYFWLEGTGAATQAVIAFTAPVGGTGREMEKLWRVRMGAFDLETQPVNVVPLLTVETAGRFTQSPAGHYEYRWIPTVTELPKLQKYCSANGESAFGCSIWFEDLVGHVTVPDQIHWRPPTMNVSVTPTPIPLGIPSLVTVFARDAAGTPVTGDVTVEGQTAGRTNVPFTHTFQMVRVREFDPETKKWLYWDAPPAGKVVADGYNPAEIPFGFFTPTPQSFTLKVTPSTLPYNKLAQVTVEVTDATTKALVPGANILIDGRVVGQGNVPFSLTRTTPASGSVTKPGYQTKTFSLPVAAPPDYTVTLEPQQPPFGRPTTLTVYTRDRDTGAPVAGTVTLDNFTSTGAPQRVSFPSNTPYSVSLYQKTTIRRERKVIVTTTTQPRAEVHVPSYGSSKRLSHPLDGSVTEEREGIG